MPRAAASGRLKPSETRRGRKCCASTVRPSPPARHRPAGRYAGRATGSGQRRPVRVSRPAMKLPLVAHPDRPELGAFLPTTGVVRWGTVAACALVLAGCATQPATTAGKSGGGRYFDPILGVWASPRLVEDGQSVPRGGGGYLVGRPYTIGGRTFVPVDNPQGYSRRSARPPGTATPSMAGAPRTARSSTRDRSRPRIRRCRCRATCGSRTSRTAGP